MRTLELCLISSLLILFSGYCSAAQQEQQPKRPDKVAGWKETYSDGVHSVAELCLRKGESSHNDKIGVQVVDVIKPQARAEGYAGMKKVKLRFYSAVDQRTLCETTFTEGGTAIGNGPPYPHCGPDMELSAISVNAINTEDNWVWFDLRK